MKFVRGFTLMEMMVAVAISMLVVLAMTRLMANTLGTGTRTIEMTRLTQQLRSALQLMSRDVRRASYSSEAILCYANIDCHSDGSISLPEDISFSADNDCFVFRHDRNHDGNAVNDGAGAFRLSSSDGIGVLEMWVGDGSPDCAIDNSDWLAITDSNSINVHTFQVDDSQSWSDVIGQDAGGNDIAQKIRKLRMRIGASLAHNPTIDRVSEETIHVRNDLLF